MKFLNSFSAQHDCLVIGLVMGTKSFEYRPYLCLWWPFKEGTHQAIFTNSECLYITVLNKAFLGHSLEKKGGLELDFAPENTSHMSRLHMSLFKRNKSNQHGEL